MIFSIRHLCFSTDDLRPTTTLVEAETPVVALSIYNAEAALKAEYPHMWTQAKLEDVSVPLILKANKAETEQQ